MAETSQTFRTTLAATGGNNVGIVVPDDVVVAFGRGKRVPVVELAHDGAARAAWGKLSYSRQRAHAESIAGAKAAETRARRVAKVLAELSAEVSPGGERSSSAAR